MSLFSQIHQALLAQAKALYRTPEQTWLLGTHQRIRFMKFAAGTFLLPLVIAIFLFIFWQTQEWSAPTAQLILKRADWRTSFGSGQTCGNPASLDTGCPANPVNPELWSSPTRRSDAEHVERVRQARGKNFWIGTTLSSEQLRSALSQNASILELGYIAGSYRIWINGDFRLQGSYRENSMPISIPLSASEMASPSDLKIAIEIQHNLGAVYPDYLGGEKETGLSTLRQTGIFSLRESFKNLVWPWMFFGVNLLLGAIFLYLWSSAPRKPELFYFALFVLNHAFMEFHFTEGFRRFAGFTVLQHLQIFLMWNEAVLVWVAGLAFARSQIIYTGPALPVALLFPLAVLPFLTQVDSYTRNFLFSLIGQSTVTFGALAGAGACWLQAYSLREKHPNPKPKLKLRLQRLISFGLAELAIAAVYFIQSKGIIASDQFVSLFRFAFFGLVLVLARIVTEDYREEQRIVEVTPLSEYHRQGTPLVTGCLLGIDLKSSQNFYRLRAERQAEEDIVADWRSHMYSVIQKFQGTVIYKKGDEIIALFDQEKHPDPMEAAHQATLAMREECVLMTERLRQERKLPAGLSGMHFRGGMTYGSLRPILETIDRREYPEWLEASDGAPLVEISRLLDCEKKLGFEKSESVLLISEGAAQRMAVIEEKTEEESSLQGWRQIETKDGLNIRVLVIRLSDDQAEPGLQALKTVLEIQQGEVAQA